MMSTKKGFMVKQLGGIDTSKIDASTEITSIKVLGPGCSSCHALLANTETAVRNQCLPV